MARIPIPGLAAALALLALAVGLAACQGTEEDTSQVATEGPTASATPIKTTAQSATPTAEASASSGPTQATITYVDATYGYSLEYPATWVISKQPDAGSIILYSYDPDGAVGDGRPVPPDKLKAFFWVAQGVNQPVEEWLAGGKNGPGQISPPTVLSQAPTALGGKQGVTETIESDGVKSTGYYIPLGGGLVFVAEGLPTGSLIWPDFESVLASVQFAS